LLNALQSISLVAAGILLSLLLLWWLRRVWPPRDRTTHNNIIGWQIGFLGTSYAVIVAFMLSDVWSSYQSADANAEVEANSLIILYRMADGLPATQGAELKALTRRYADSVITDEWPAMYEGRTSGSGMRLIQSMWKVTLQSQPQTSGEQVVLNRAVTEMASLAEHRRIRQLQSRSRLPGIFWRFS